MMVDTLTIAREPKAADLPAGQAEAIAAAIGHSLAEATDARATSDRLLTRIDALERTLTAQIQTLDAQITARIDNARATLLTWLMGVIIATAGVIIAVLKL